MNENLIDEAAVAAALTFKTEIDFTELEEISHKVKAVLKKHFEDRENESHQAP